MGKCKEIYRSRYKGWTQKFKDWIAISFLFLLVTIFLKGVLSFKNASFLSEFFDEQLPFLNYVSNYLKAGILPIWIPDIYCGFPLIANIQQSFFYPLNILLFPVLPTPFALLVTTVVHYFLAGFFSYLYARVLKLDRASCLVSASIFAFNGFMLDDVLGELHTLSTLVWLPLILFLIEKSVQKEGRIRYKYIIMTGIVLGVQFLGGMFHYSYFIVFVTCAYLIWKYFELFKTQRRLRCAKEICFVLILIFIIGIGIFAVQLLPTYELSKYSARASLSYKDAVSGNTNLSLRYLIEFVFPNYMRGSYVGVFSHAHFGVIVLLLTIIAIFKRKEKIIWFYFTVGVVSLLLALGKYTPLFWLLYHLRLPGFSMFEDPMKIEIIFIFSISILAGFGFDVLILNKNKWKDFRRLVMALSVLLSIAAIIIAYTISREGHMLSSSSSSLALFNVEHFPEKLFDYLYELTKKALAAFCILNCAFIIAIFAYMKGKIQPWLFKAIIMALVFLNLYLFRPMNVPYWGDTKGANFRALLQIPQTAKFLQQDKELFRFFSYDAWEDCPKLQEELAWPKWFVAQEVMQNLWYKEKLVENMGLRYGLSSVSGHTPLPLRRYLELTKGCPDIDDPARRDGYLNFVINYNLIRLFNVKYVITNADSASFKGASWKEVYNDDINKVYLNKDYLPRAFFVTEAIVIKDKSAILETLKSESFDPQRTVVLEEFVNSSIRGEDFTLHSTSKVKIVRYLPNEVVVGVKTSDNGFLVLLDTYYPGWEVYVDGIKDKIYRANYLFRAVYLSKGNHTVEFSYNPFTFKIGLFISLATLFLSLVSLVMINHNNRKIGKW